MAATYQVCDEDKLQPAVPRGKPPDNNGDRSQGTANMEEEKLSLISRLLLSAELMGAEAGTSFEQLYTVPNLQTLGMPLSLVSMTGLMSGTLATILLPLIGWYSDRGANPRCRKAWAVGLSPILMVCGLLVVTAANMLHLKYFSSALTINQTNLVSSTTLNSSHEIFNLTNFHTDSKSHARNSTLLAYHKTSLSTSVQASTVPQLMSSIHNSTLGDASDRPNDLNDGVPYTAGLGMCGYVMMDVAYDCITSTTKTWMLTCSPRSQPAPTLVAGLAMTSFGGMLSSALGMVDLSSALGLSSESKSGLAIQITIQAAAVFVVVLLGTISSLLSGDRLRRRKSHSQLQDKTISYEQNIPANVDQRTNDVSLDARCTLDLARKTSSSEELSAVSFTALREGGSNVVGSQTTSLSDRVPENASEISPHYCGTTDNDRSFAEGKLSVDSSASEDSGLEDNDRRQLLKGNKEKPKFLCSPCRSKRSYRATLVILCCSTYFAVGVITIYMLTGSDFVGKAIYGGDPDAPPGSDSLARYQEGIRAASYGFVLYFAVYLVFSFVQQRLLALLGYKWEYVLIQLLMSVCLVLLALTARMETFFLLCTVAGIHRAVFHVVCFSVISDIVHAESKRRPDDRSPKLGLAMSAVTATMPLAYSTLFPWIGPLEEMTGILAMPLWLAAGFGCISAILFLLLGL